MSDEPAPAPDAKAEDAPPAKPGDDARRSAPPSQPPRAGADSVLRKIARNVLSSWIYIVASAVSSIFLTPYLIHRLGDTGYGIITTIAGLVGYSGILYLGMGGAVVRYSAEYLAKNDKVSLREMLSTIFGVYCGMGLFCFLACLGLAYPLPWLLNIPEESVLDARAVLLMTGFALLIQFPGSVFSGFVQGANRYDVLNGRMLFVLVVRIAATIAILEYRPSVIAIGALTAVTAILEALWSVLYVRWRFPDVRFGPRGFRRARLKSLLGFSLRSMFLNVSNALIQSTDEAVISQARGPAMVTPYVIPLRLGDYARQLMDKATETLVPTVVEAATHKDTARLQAVWRFTVKAGLAIGIPIALVFIVWGHDVISLWIGDRHANDGSLALAFLAVAFLAQIPGRSVTYPVMIALNDLSAVVRIVIIEGVLNLALSVVLVRTELGIAGVALGTAIPAALTGFVMLPYVACRAVGVSFLSHTLETVVRGALPVPITLGAMYGLHALGLTRSIPTLALACLGALVVHLAASAVLCLSAADRALVLKKIRRR